MFNRSYTNYENAYITILNSDGSLKYSTLLSGNNRDRMRDMLLDNNNNIYIYGDSLSTDLLFTHSFPQQSSNFAYNLFLGKLVYKDNLSSSNDSNGSTSPSSNTTSSFEFATLGLILLLGLKLYTRRKAF